MRLDFLKLVVGTAEGHLRALDVKAQIVLAAFILSWTPLLLVVHTACHHGLTRTALLAVPSLVVATVAAFGLAIWPFGAASAADQAQRPPRLFYLQSGRDALNASSYVQRLHGAALADELAGEALALAALRDAKTRRLRAALLLGGVTYVVFLGLVVTGRYCV